MEDEDRSAWEEEDDELTKFLTNVLVIYNIPKHIDHHDLAVEITPFCAQLKESKYIKPLCTAVLVFQTVDAAIECKGFLQSKFNVYFGKAIDDEVLKQQLLEPPPNKRAFLKSPPASPPPGWKPRVESPPIPSEAHICTSPKSEKHIVTLQEAGQTTPAIFLEQICENPLS